MVDAGKRPNIVDLARVATRARDPAGALRAIAVLRLRLDELERVNIENARVSRLSWTQIGRALGVSRQAVHKRYARRPHGAVEGLSGRPPNLSP